MVQLLSRLSTHLRPAAGTVVALAGLAALAGIILPFRSGLSEATPALILLLPVTAGAALGGPVPGLLGALAGFAVYDVLFIPPYDTLTVGSRQGWVALLVYLMVALLVSQLITAIARARLQATQQQADTARVSALTDQLIADQPLPELLQLVADTVMLAFDPRWTAVLLPDEAGRLNVAATAGPAPPAEELAGPVGSGGLQTLGVWAHDPDGMVSVALHVHDRPIGLLALSGARLDAHQREHLRLYADQAARAVERSQLRQLALDNQALESSDRWRRALLGAVSHDLRTPLATVKAAVSALRQSRDQLSGDEQEELLSLVEGQADDLARLVTNLLDVTRIQAGALQLQRRPVAVRDLAEGALRALGGTIDEAATGALGDILVVLDVPDELPEVEVDEQLMVQAVANVLDNAWRHSPADQPITVSARLGHDHVALTIEDHGAGVAPELAGKVFDLWVTAGGEARAGLGLSITRAFVEAHGQKVSLDTAYHRGARFVITLPVWPGA